MNSDPVDTLPVLLGTAGHIDHGKTRLVSALTGTNTDRLPEEQRRGISIDLGFAHFDHNGIRFGIVDVPGHERFVRQMVAGATSLDAAVLVIAADDGVMPQTVEHFEILRMLGIPRGVIAITKVDLVDDEMQELVAEEVLDLVRGSFLENSPIVAVSSETGQGIDDLRDRLADVTRSGVQIGCDDPFRMPIDRVFSLSGRGTIVTGSVLTGQIAAGDEVELLPVGRRLRVRSVQHHGEQVDVATARRRAAINLPGINVDEIHRGYELTTPDSLLTSHRLLAEATCLKSSVASLSHRMLLDLHIGTQVTPIRLRLDGEEISPGESGFVEFRCRHPVTATWGQRFILRSSRGLTVGGGRIIDPLPGRFRIRDRAVRLQGAASDSETERLRSLLSVQPSLAPAETRQRLGIPPDRLPELLESQALQGEIVKDPGSGQYVHQNWLDRLGRSVVRVLTEELQRRQPLRVLPESILLGACRRFRGSEFIPLAISRLEKKGVIVRRGSQLGPADMQVELTRRQRNWMDCIMQEIEAGGRTPPTHKELLSSTGVTNAKELNSLISLAREDGSLVGVSPELTYSPGSLRTIVQEIQQAFAGSSTLTLSQIRDALGMTRKHVVPLAEYFDEIGATVREGDTRTAGPALQEALSAEEH